MQKLFSVINEYKSGIYFTSKTETLLDVENKFNIPKRLIAVQNNLTCLSVTNRALMVTKYAKTYVVKPTDTIKNICEKFGVLAETLLKINQITYLYPGQKIILSDE